MLSNLLGNPLIMYKLASELIVDEIAAHLNYRMFSSNGLDIMIKYK